MRRLLALIAIVAGSTIMGTFASAGEWGGHGCRQGGWSGPAYRGHDYVGSYAKQHGVKFANGYFYPGKEQKHFTEKWHDYRFGIDVYWDPHARCPYYWCEGHGVYYPIRHIYTVPPDAKGPGPAVGGDKRAPSGPPKPGEPAANGPTNKTPGGQGGQPGDAPPQPASGDAKVSVARNQSPASAPKKEVNGVPPGTFDDAVPDEP